MKEMATALSSQLAAISSRNNGGITAAASSSSSSRRPRQQRLLPSILRNNAREASSISLVTLRENAAAALNSLWREMVATIPNNSSNDGSVMVDDDVPSSNSNILLANPTKLLSTSNLDHYERGTSTVSENEIVDGYIEEMLSFLMTCLVEQYHHYDYSSSSTTTSTATTVMSCLHIIEYLLRKYEIHTRANTASLLLQAVLPFHIIVLTHGRKSSSSSSSGGHHPGGEMINNEQLVFARILTLVHDLLDGNQLPLWSFLLPFAASSSLSGRGVGQSGDISMLNRHKLAKFVAKDDAMTLVIVNIGKRAMEIGVIEGRGKSTSSSNSTESRRVKKHDDDCRRNGGTSGAVPVRRGISTLISFSASILVEACSIQLSSNTNAGGGMDTDGKLIVAGVRESYVRVLFPVVLSACKSGLGGGRKTKGSEGVSKRDQYYWYCPEWKEWGRILASTLATSCPFLGEKVKIALCDAIVDGLSPPPPAAAAATIHGKASTKMDDAKVVASSEWTEDACSAIMTLLSILATMSGVDEERSTATSSSSPACDDDDKNTSWQYYLPILPPPRRKNNLQAATTIDFVGCALPISTYKRMLSSENNGASMVSMAMGAVLKSFCEERGKEDDDDGAGRITERSALLLASIIMHAFCRLEKEAIRKIMKSSSSSASKKKNKSHGGDNIRDAKDDEFRADREVEMICNMVSDYLFFHRCVCIVWLVFP